MIKYTFLNRTLRPDVCTTVKLAVDVFSSRGIDVVSPGKSVDSVFPRCRRRLAPVSLESYRSFGSIRLMRVTTHELSNIVENGLNVVVFFKLTNELQDVF